MARAERDAFALSSCLKWRYNRKSQGLGGMEPQIGILQLQQNNPASSLAMGREEFQPWRETGVWMCSWMNNAALKPRGPFSKLQSLTAALISMHGLLVMTDFRQISRLKASSQIQCHIVHFWWFWFLYLSVSLMFITIVLRENNSNYPKSVTYNDAESKWKDPYLWPTFRMTNTDISLIQRRFTDWGDAPRSPCPSRYVLTTFLLT